MSLQIVGFVLLAVLLLGATPRVEKMGFSRSGGNVDPFSALAIRSAAAFLGLVVVTLVMDKWQPLVSTNARAVAFFSVSGLMAGLLGTWAYLIAMKSGEASQVVPLSATYPLVTALLSYLVLKENMTFNKIVGTVFVVLGIWLLK